MTPSKTSTATISEPPELLKADLGWLCAQTLTAYLRAAEPVLQNMPGVMRGPLDNLERAGLVTRKPNPTDRRERAIAVTPAGTKRLTAIRTQLERATQHVLSPLSARQRDTFLDALHTVVAHLALPENQ